MTALETKLNEAVAEIVQTAKDLRARSDTTSLHLEVRSLATEIRTERTIARDERAAQELRVDQVERRVARFEEEYKRQTVALEGLRAAMEKLVAGG